MFVASPFVRYPVRTLVLLFFTVLMAASAAAQDADRPPHRVGHATAYDVARDRIVLFGGVSLGRERPLSDTWEWDGSRWTRLMPTVSPAPRAAAAMVYDAARQRVVMYGGATQDGPLGDTWEWDGSAWTERAVSEGPGARMYHTLAYDAARQRVILIGGIRGDAPQNDVWEWDGAAWQVRLEASEYEGPGPFESTRMKAYRAQLKSDLRNLATAQEAYLADNIAYASSMEQLGNMFSASSGVTVTITIGSGLGWAALAVTENAEGARCGIFVGNAEPPFAEVVDEAVPVCTGFPD